MQNEAMLFLQKWNWILGRISAHGIFPDSWGLKAAKLLKAPENLKKLETFTGKVLQLLQIFSANIATIIAMVFQIILSY